MIDGISKADFLEFLKWFQQQPIEEFMANCIRFANGDVDSLREEATVRYMMRKLDEWCKLTGRESAR